MTLFDYLNAYNIELDLSQQELLATEQPFMATATPDLTELQADTSPADLWLSGNEWAGEAEVGGMPLASGTVDTSGQGNDVNNLDGEVLTPPV